MKINSHNEWDELKEIIVGSAESMACLIFSSEKPVSDKTIETAYELARQAYPQNLLDEINEDLDELCDVLKDFGAKIYRPNISDVNKIYSSPNLDGYHVYIHFIKSLDWNKVIYLRNRWKDDGNRVVIDIQKTIPQTMMISFKSKSRNGYRYFEIPMFSESGNDFAN